MSLINRVLQDLDQRGAKPSRDSQYSGDIRTVAAQASNRRRRQLAWLLAVCGAVLVALVVWPGVDRFKDFPQRHWAQHHNSPRVTSPLIPVGQPRPVEPDQETVATALIVPVFQLSTVLTILPTNAARSPSTSSNVRPATEKKTPARTAINRSQTKAVTSDMSSTPLTQTQTAIVAKKQPVAKLRPVAQGDIAKMPVVQEEPLEQIVISADLPVSQLEKRAHELTAYERAEVAFRGGVDSLRRGRLDEAESQFRLAINEDRSHAAAQQALIGMLIDAGRLQDAEFVLNQSLELNPRQPTLAMVLARLRVERGDLETAVKTLDRVSVYAGTDANFLSFMAAVLQRAQRHEEAVVRYRNALALMPGNPVWLMGLGISLRELGESEQALQAFAAAAAMGTLNPDLQAFVERRQRELQHAVN